MRRLLLTFVLVPTFAWVFWASCQSDDFRDTLPFRVFDAAPREAGPPVSVPDLGRADLGDMSQQSPMDLTPRFDGAGPGDGGSSDGGLDAGVPDAGGPDAGAPDGGIDGGRGDM